MRLQSEARTVEMDGFTGKKKAYTIESSAMMFKILSDKLYSDKILAVIREYGCNAFDAHVMAGTQDKPFDVHLPNNFEPYFFIRDYGTGLSEEEVYDIYTTYGKSTKSDRNDQIGALGLGSKSAFAYVDQFVVQSWHGGMLKTYNAFMDESGEPNIIKMSEEDSTEPNGVKVQLMAKTEDISSFADRAKKVFHRFPVLPNLSGNRDADLTQVKYTLNGPNYKLRESNSDEAYRYGEHRACFAVQGTVAYPILMSNMNCQFTDKQRSLLQYMPLDIEFPIGELDIAPNREGLSYDKRTQENILKALNAVINHVPAFAISVLADAATEWEAKMLYDSWIGDRSTQANFMRTLLDNKLLWNGKKVENNIIKVFTYDRVKAETAAKDDFKHDHDDYEQDALLNKLTTYNIEKYGDCVYFSEGTIRSQRSSSRRKTTPSYHTEVKVQVSTKTQIVFADDDKKARKLSRYIAHNFTNGESVYVFRVEPTKRAQVLTQLGGCPNIKMLSELEEPPVEVKDPTVVKRDVRQCYEVKGFYDYGNPPLNLVETQYDVTQGGIFIMMYAKQICHPGHEFESAEDGGAAPPTGGRVNDIIKLAHTLGLLNGITVHAFNSSKGGIVKKYPNWINLYDYLRTKINELADKKEDIFAMAAHHKLMQDVGIYDDLLEHGKVIKSMPITKPNSRMFKLLETVNGVNSRVEAFIGTVDSQKSLNTRNYHPDIAEFLKYSEELLGTTGYKGQAKVDAFVKKFGDDVNKYYPLLTHLISHFDFAGNRYNSDATANKKKVAHYINLCDASPSLVSNF